ncbi:hypothetical protein CNR22_15110 [Sphingobacteriaceae bacterium]|nr:hypothetical protein CNR22_15110 [Sphingobacteriaceae bacterium]
MNKRQVIITSLSELETEERRVRQRIKKQEAELMLRVKKLPEELVSTAVVKVVSGLISGDTAKTVMGFIKKIAGNLISNIFEKFSDDK